MVTVGQPEFLAFIGKILGMAKKGSHKKKNGAKQQSTYSHYMIGSGMSINSCTNLPFDNGLTSWFKSWEIQRSTPAGITIRTFGIFLDFTNVQLT